MPTRRVDSAPTLGVRSEKRDADLRKQADAPEHVNHLGWLTACRDPIADPLQTVGLRPVLKRAGGPSWQPYFGLRSTLVCPRSTRSRRTRSLNCSDTLTLEDGRRLNSSTRVSAGLQTELLFNRHCQVNDLELIACSRNSRRNTWRRCRPGRSTRWRTLPAVRRRARPDGARIGEHMWDNKRGEDTYDE